jgi:hypothetical protein
MQPGGSNELRIIRDSTDMFGDCSQMDGIGMLRILAPVINTLMGIDRVFAGTFNKIHSDSPFNRLSAFTILAQILIQEPKPDEKIHLVVSAWQ